MSKAVLIDGFRTIWQPVTRVKQGFALAIPEAQRLNENCFEIEHGCQYRVVLTNLTNRRCDAFVTIDGTHCGAWRIDAEECIVLERPADDSGRFTFYRIGSRESVMTGIDQRTATGTLEVAFKPEEYVIVPYSWNGTGGEADETLPELEECFFSGLQQNLWVKTFLA